MRVECDTVGVAGVCFDADMMPFLLFPCTQMYYDWSNGDAFVASSLKEPGKPVQHMYGDAFTVAPITAFVNNATGRLPWALWVPPGTWVDYWTGAVQTGPSWYQREYTVAETPLLVRAGAVVPMKTLADAHNVAARALILAVTWAGPTDQSGSGRVYEDDGSSLAYQSNAFSIATVTFVASDGMAKLQYTPGTAGQGYLGMPFERSYALRIRNAPPTASNITCSLPNAQWFWETEGLLPVLVVGTDTVSSVFGFDISFLY
jgi:hypothetical protein